MTEKRVWLVTGAGRGMGVDIAKAALAAGHAVVATGRNPDKVSAAVDAHDDLMVVELDVIRTLLAQVAGVTDLDGAVVPGRAGLVCVRRLGAEQHQSRRHRQSPGHGQCRCCSRSPHARSRQREDLAHQNPPLAFFHAPDGFQRRAPDPDRDTRSAAMSTVEGESPGLVRNLVDPVSSCRPAPLRRVEQTEPPAATFAPPGPDRQDT